MCVFATVCKAGYWKDGASCTACAANTFKAASGDGTSTVADCVDCIGADKDITYTGTVANTGGTTCSEYCRQQASTPTPVSLLARGLEPPPGTRRPLPVADGCACQPPAHGSLHTMASRAPARGRQCRLG